MAEPDPPQKTKRVHEGSSEASSQVRPAKKAKSSSTNISNAAGSNTADSAIPSDPLTASFDITCMSIISSSKIEQKVARTLAILAEYLAVPPSKPKVVRLHAKALVASKMITIAEIAKREISKGGGKWFQYTKVDEIMEERKISHRKGKQQTAEDEEDPEGEDDEEEEEAFETMKTPFERSIEGKPKVRGVPVMTLYLSRVRIDSLRKEYGEQTNALAVTK